MSEYKFFYGGFCSQWFRCDFEIDGVQYNCAEQYMMAEKARCFGDKAMELAIMQAGHPRDQKHFGRKVKGFNEEEWNAVARDVVYRGNYAKFTQNPGLEYELRDTVGQILVEASPTDRIWGIGRDQFDPEIEDPEYWDGTNWLGEVLMKVRDDIIAGVESKEFNWS